jgi:hypothetical protein
MRLRGDGTGERLVWTPDPRPWRRFNPNAGVPISLEEFEAMRRSYE